MAIAYSADSIAFGAIRYRYCALRSPLRADAAASIASSPAFRDDRDTPPLAGKDWQTCVADLPVEAEQELWPAGWSELWTAGCEQRPDLGPKSLPNELNAVHDGCSALSNWKNRC